jgi:hypothetical protein
LTLRSIVFIALATLAAFVSVRSVSESQAGDFGVYCAGLRALDANGDVYDMQVLQARFGSPSPFPMPNPAIVLPLLRPACATGHYLPYWFGVTALAFVAIGLLDRTPDWPLLAVTMASGFASLYWMLATGNIAPLECLLVSVGLMGLYSARRGWFAAGLGIAAFVKTIPAALVPVAWLTGEPRQRWRNMLGAAAVCVAFYALFLVTMRAQFVPYWEQLVGLRGILVDEVVAGGEFHPSILSAAGDVSRAVTRHAFAGVAIYVLIVAVIARDFLFRVVPASRGAAAWSLPFVAVLAILLVFPRLKPYSFNMALVPLYVLMKPLTLPRQVRMLGVACVVPIAGIVLTQAWPGVRVLHYGQLIALAGVYLLVRPPHSAAIRPS